MSLIIKLAWRNLWRNSRRTIITILAVTFATLFSIAMRGIQLGTYEETINFAVGLFSGYLQIQHKDYQESPSLHKSFVLDGKLRDIITGMPEVRGYAPRVYADGLASYKNTSLGAVIFGVDPEREKAVTTFPKKIDQGRFIRGDNSNEIVVGYKMLRNLRAEVGDEIILLSQGYDGSLGNARFRIVGTLKMGSPDFDGMGVFMGLSRLQELLGMGHRINVVALSLNSVYDVEQVADKLNQVLRASTLSALRWDQVMPELKQGIELDNISGMIYLFILILVVAFGILNTVLMSVTERFKEFGILLSVGMPQGMLVAVVFIETVFIALIGIVIGNILAVGVNYYFYVNPIEFTGEYKAMMEQYGFLPVLRSSLKLSSFFNTTLSIFAISLVSTIYPLVRTYKLEPLKGIRYT
ncbi:MAG: ABC transporter permease [Chlorobi bacterium]|nr:ABC transporter permease [Chlorobiota bacterium]